MTLSPEQLDALQEPLNIGVGRAAGFLDQMLGKPIRLYIPSIRSGPIEELRKEREAGVSALQASVQLPFHGSFSGSTCLLFPTQSTASLVAIPQVISKTRNL